MITITLYTHSSRSAEEEKTRKYLDKIKHKIPLQVVTINIAGDRALEQKYENQIPFLQVGPYHLSWPFSEQELWVACQAANDRETHLDDKKDPTRAARIKRSRTFTRVDRFTLWFSDHYMLVFNLLVGIYVGMAFLAPMLMKVGARGPARLIYTAYSPLCHQLAYRSWFLFGEQWFYPRELAGIEGYLGYEEATGLSASNVLEARHFLGNDVLGYKVALCERDIAIYAGILLFGIVFSLSGNRMKSIPWYVWLFVGIVPLGLDGISQLPSLLPFLPDWLPIRESTPFLRTLTGLLFGVTTAWYGYPLVDESIQDTRRVLVKKKAITIQLMDGLRDDE